jgi:hypothetical protein
VKVFLCVALLADLTSNCAALVSFWSKDQIGIVPTQRAADLAAHKGRGKISYPVPYGDGANPFTERSDLWRVFVPGLAVRALGWARRESPILTPRLREA